ncbi:RHS repeat-associated core domain-containing protein [Myroides ceti]|uniref:RHS repeat-associated core domain-containing protein n=1 Tax=Paenimyroides ceti TaxID=395087 RepID=A0ABT8CRG5_9FLAO|nr:RHS repeat-associated core domain-containing protein [Paenimyroides ceti]MDN3707098.1 RHS repeat-associated core domain-containing protein [Paenimyroides ceti]
MVEHNQSQYYGNQYKFNGKELDSTTGMYYYGARYYEPRFSIFVSVDPLAEQTMTPYQYVHNNPINLIDPTGMNAEPPVKGLQYFRDDTGEYFWNKEKDKYEHYVNDKDGSKSFKGYYDASSFKEPVGDYFIDFNSAGSQKDTFDISKTITSISDPLYSVLNLMGQIKNISNPEKYPGVEIYSSPHMNGALTAGNVIFTNPDMQDKNTLDHEYGHYLDYKHNFEYKQKEYLKTIAIPSIISATRSTVSDKYKHEKSQSEKRANRLGGAWTGNKDLKNIYRN